MCSAPILWPRLCLCLYLCQCFVLSSFCSWPIRMCTNLWPCPTHNSIICYIFLLAVGASQPIVLHLLWTGKGPQFVPALTCSNFDGALFNWQSITLNSYIFWRTWQWRLFIEEWHKWQDSIANLTEKLEEIFCSSFATFANIQCCLCLCMPVCLFPSLSVHLSHLFAFVIVNK